jgi:two-component system OmpR family sensor kinase
VSSLRRRLLLSLWLALLIVGTGSAGFIYVQTREETNSTLDHQMGQVATLLATQSFSTSMPLRITPHPDGNHDAEDDLIVDVRDTTGRLLYASQSDVQLPPHTGLGFHTITLRGIDYRIFATESGERRIAIAQQMDVRWEAATDAALSALLPVGILVPVLGVLIAFVVHRELQPLRATAAGVASRPPLSLDPLLVTGLPSEVRPLIEEINRLLARLQTATERERRFIADAAHALRTPLTALQLQADVLDGSTDAIETASRIADLRAGIRRAVRLSNHLLMLSHYESTPNPALGQIELDATIWEAQELYIPIAVAHGIELHINAHSDAIVPGDARQLAQLTGNLLDNALRYTATGGCVAVSASAGIDGALIEVVDEGPGLPESELEEVFERFHRSPGDATEGSGLGLAVVHEIAKRLGGRVQLANRTDRSGLIARVWLPSISATSPNAT